MFSAVRQTGRCTCQCMLLSKTPASSVLVSKRNYENANTHVFKRKHEVGMTAVGKYPLIKRKHYILEILPNNPDYKTTMKCILTQEIEGIGLKGTLVEVKKNLFRNKLYPQGLAVYASPENLEFYESYRKDSEEEGIDYQTKTMMNKLAGLHLPVFMNTEKSWVLNEEHLRIALRKVGVWVENDNVIPPERPVVQSGDFVFQLQLDKRLMVKVQGTVYPVGEDGLPEPKLKLPEKWGNSPVDKHRPIEYLKRAKQSPSESTSSSPDSDTVVGTSTETDNNRDPDSTTPPDNDSSNK